MWVVWLCDSTKTARDRRNIVLPVPQLFVFVRLSGAHVHDHASMQQYTYTYGNACSWHIPSQSSSPKFSYNTKTSARAGLLRIHDKFLPNVFDINICIVRFCGVSLKICWAIENVCQLYTWSVADDAYDVVETLEIHILQNALGLTLYC